MYSSALLNFHPHVKITKYSSEYNSSLIFLSTRPAGLSPTKSSSSPCSNETHLTTRWSTSFNCRRMHDMLVVTTSVRMLNRLENKNYNALLKNSYCLQYPHALPIENITIRKHIVGGYVYSTEQNSETDFPSHIFHTTNFSLI